MRWIIDPEDFMEPNPARHFLVFRLLADRHSFRAGARLSFWEVGLAAGIVYNWWIVRRRSLWDCIIAHAVTNGVLAAYVIGAGQWQYWL